MSKPSLNAPLTFSSSRRAVSSLATVVGLVAAGAPACTSEKGPGATGGHVENGGSGSPGTGGATTGANGATTAAGASSAGAAAGGTTSGGATTGSAGTASAGTGAAPTSDEYDAGGSVALAAPPHLFSATTSGFWISVVLAGGDPELLGARVRIKGEDEWGAAKASFVRADDLAEWQFQGLQAGTDYEYEILSGEGEDERMLYAGNANTAREAGESFSFAMISDTHIGAHLEYSNQGDEHVLAAISSEIGATSPDFLINLGDTLDFHEFGFNSPPPDGSFTKMGYLNYRATLAETAGNTVHFGVIGNWEGENGDYTSDQIARSREQRLLYLPGPEPTTYPEGGSPGEDYYAFQWGDALFIVLNVMTYTPTPHLLSTSPGLPDDWTLGEEQLGWLETTLQNATSKWRFLFIHHAVGGAAGDAANSSYGRGGGQAAYVGEQAMVHQMMMDYGAQIFFYGHDHVFTDMVVDDIHYTDPSNAGAIWTFSGLETGYETYWSNSGWAQVDVTPDKVNVKFVAQGGELLNEYSVE